MTQHLDAPAVGTTTAATVPAGEARSSADRFMRRLLRLPVDGPKATAKEAQKAFQTSILVATVRCLLMYIFFPFVLPLIGEAKGVGPIIGLVIGLLAIVSIVFSIRRFWRANHSKRWHYTIFGLVIIGFLIALAIKDLSTIAS
jgi:formate hydrogenlyase subunit 3/multisubunit Na+/H+ antiporter MnhD subunit